MNRFWMVHGEGPCNRRHTTRHAAEQEADRLARANTGKVFFVTEAISAHVKRDVERFSLRADGALRMPADMTRPIPDDFDDIPF